MPHLTGTFVNAGAVLAGTLGGSFLGTRFPERIRDTVIHTIGLFTLVLGAYEGSFAFQGALARLTRGSVLIVLASVLVGGVVGEIVGVENGLNAAGEALKRRFGRGQSRFTEGFVVASLVFCVGPLTILGSIQEGVRGDASLLLIKSMLDGFAALAFASVLGWGVGFSVITILVFQGTLTLAAHAVAGVFDAAMIAALTATGGLMILGIGLRLLELREVRVANLLPALVLAPVAVVLVEHFT